MKAFVDLYEALDASTKTNDKVAALCDYFAGANPEDAAWTIYFLSGRRPKRPVSTTTLKLAAQQAAGLSDWLFTECYDAAGDLAETITLVLPDAPNPDTEDTGLSAWVQTMIALTGKDPEVQIAEVQGIWLRLSRGKRFLFNKLITGGFRVGISQDLVVRALAKQFVIPTNTLAHRMMGKWEPTGQFFEDLISSEGATQTTSQPYPFCLAHPIDGSPDQLGEPADWAAEWKWDGIRAQVIRRGGETFVWSRGEELINDSFPEVVALGDQLPDGTVLDGEILAWGPNGVLPFAELQRRIGRKAVGKKLLTDVPVRLVAFDILEHQGQDLRGTPWQERRQILEQMSDHGVQIAPLLSFDSWDQLAKIRAEARQNGVEGLMLKSRAASYEVGRKRGIWWKWKVEAMTVDAVLIYAQRGSGRRASLYSDYTFAVWKDGALVPIAKAYSGLSDEEMRRVDAYVKANTLEKFGPVRTVTPKLVFELAFEGIQLSKRHKSGIAVRFPRIHRWREDKKPEEADQLEAIIQLLRAQNPES